MKTTFDRILEVRDSSNIMSAWYDHVHMILRVEFKEGKFYYYDKVPSSVFGKLCGAESVGSFFANHVRDKFNIVMKETKEK